MALYKSCNNNNNNNNNMYYTLCSKKSDAKIQIVITTASQN